MPDRREVVLLCFFFSLVSCSKPRVAVLKRHGAKQSQMQGGNKENNGGVFSLLVKSLDEMTLSLSNSFAYETGSPSPEL